MKEEQRFTWLPPVTKARRPLRVQGPLPYALPVTNKKAVMTTLAINQRQLFFLVSGYDRRKKIQGRKGRHVFFCLPKFPPR